MADDTNEVIQDDIEDPGGGNDSPQNDNGNPDDPNQGDNQGGTSEPTEEEKADAVKLLFNIVFEKIVPWGSPGGDTGLSSRLKLQRNFEKIKTWIDSSPNFYLSRLYDDIAHGHITFNQGLTALGNIILGEYAEGVQGGILTPDGDAELRQLVTRGLAKLQELFVVTDSTFGGNLSSIEFISAFLGGKGWAIQKKTRINAAGVEEEYYTLEIDNVTVRETLRVYEMIVSQLRGEFDNYVFASMMEVHHYDPATGKVWLTTESGRIKAVPFKQGDYIMVQQYQAGNDVVSGGDGYITKHYELIITDSGTGGQEDENGDRLDWVTFKNFVTSIEDGTPETVIQKKDTFVRVDNETDPERKGLMQIITVGPNTPYQDVYYGMKTDPNDALKLRTGNLQGIRTDLFGWLEGFGAYLPNVYAVGKFYNRQTGESLNSSIEITRERLKSVYTETTYNIQDEDNFLTNGFFARDMESWTKCNVDGSAASADVQQQVIDSGNGTPLMVNGAVLAYMNRLTAEVTDYDGIRVLHLLGMGVYQDFSDIKANSTHKANKSDNDQSNDYTSTKDVYDRLYMGVRLIPVTTGTLSVTFVRSNGTVISSWSQQLNASHEWELVQSSDTEADPWQYTGEQGRMILAYTGECYIRFVALRTDPIVNSRETYMTMFEQTSRRITLQAVKQTADLNEAVAEINIEFDNVKTTVTNNKKAADDAFASMKDDLDAEVEAREDLEEYYHATWVYQNDHLLSLMAAEFNADGTIKGYADLKIQVNGISTTVTNNKKAADDAFATLNNTTLPAIRKDIDDAYDLADSAWDKADDAQDSVDTINATWIMQNQNKIELVSALFDSQGKPTSASGLMLSSSFAGLFTAAMSENKVATEGYIATYLAESGYVDDDGVREIISVATISADQIDFTFTKYSSWTAGGVTVMTLDTYGNLNITGALTQNAVIKGSDGNEYNSTSVVNQFITYNLTLTSQSTYLYYTNGAIQAIIKSSRDGDKNVYLPTLGNIRQALGISSYDNRDFCCQLTIINQAPMAGSTYAYDNVFIYGGDQNYTDTVTSTSSRPRVMRGADDKFIQLEGKYSAIFFITYINRKFIANYIKG